jgi:hypothetical protein
MEDWTWPVGRAATGSPPQPRIMALAATAPAGGAHGDWSLWRGGPSTSLRIRGLTTGPRGRELRASGQRPHRVGAR